MKKILAIVLVLSCFQTVMSQNVKWTYWAEPDTAKNVYKLFFKADIKEGHYIGDQYQPQDSKLVPLTVTVNAHKNIESQSTSLMSIGHQKGYLIWADSSARYKHSGIPIDLSHGVTFVKFVKLKQPMSTLLTGEITCQVATKSGCYYTKPDKQEFTMMIYNYEP